MLGKLTTTGSSNDVSSTCISWD